MAQYSQQQLRKLFETLPAELKEAILSEETANSIRDVCERNSVTEENISKVASMVGRTLMGLLPPEDFSVILTTDIGIDDSKARRISQEISRFIFFSVKHLLIEFYKEIKFVPGGRLEKIATKKEPPIKEEPAIEAAGLAEKPTRAAKKPRKARKAKRKAPVEKKDKGADDTYREIIE